MAIIGTIGQGIILMLASNVGNYPPQGRAADREPIAGSGKSNCPVVNLVLNCTTFKIFLLNFFSRSVNL
jgi:hypothetical protein